MILKYEVSFEDIVDFNLYQVKNSRSAKKALLLQRIIAPLTILILVFLIGHFDPDSFPFMITFGIVFSILVIVFYPLYFKWRIKKSIKNALKEGNNKGVFGEQTLIITEEEIIETNSDKEIKTRWTAVEKIVHTDQNILIYIGSYSAIVIPIRSFESKEKAFEFIRLIQNYEAKKQ